MVSSNPPGAVRGLSFRMYRRWMVDLWNSHSEFGIRRAYFSSTIVGLVEMLRLGRDGFGRSRLMMMLRTRLIAGLSHIV